jgi:secretion/DNA translocation related TadE-like protein
MGESCRPCEHGSMTVVGVGAAAVLMTVCLVGAALAGFVSIQHRAAAAADLAALASARSPATGCRAAAAVAADNGVELEACEVVGSVVTVTVRIKVASVLGHAPTIRSRARAGPADLAARG